MKKSKSKAFFVETADVRDGLFPSLRFALAQMHTMNEENNGKFRKSTSIANNIAEKLQTDPEEVYETLINAARPRCHTSLVYGQGNMGFPPASMEYSLMQVSDFYNRIICQDNATDFNLPLAISVPYVLYNGTMWNTDMVTRIPSHNLGEVLDATMALIENPNLDTKDLMKYIKGPDLLVGGTITNPDKLCEFYERGYGVFEITVTSETLNTWFDKTSEFTRWYGFKLRRNLFKREQKILIPYRAFLFDGNTSRFMSLKEILQKHIEYYKSVKDMTDEDLYNRLKENKEVPAERITEILN